METYSFTIYNASAGSGKTYTLTKEYLKILLLAKTSDAYKKILAITFTNKAVEEMKTRVVTSLFEFSKENTAEEKLSLLYDVARETKLSIAVIKQKSAAIITSIIHNYTAFGISTIDKFTHKVIRSFAQDLNLPANFEVALDTDSLLQEAVDVVISKVGEDENLTSLLVDFTKTKTDDDKNWDISRELFEVSKLITNENNSEKIAAFKEKKFTDFANIKKIVHAKIEEISQICIDLANDNLQKINQNSSVDSFFKKYVPNYFQRISSGNLSINTTPIKYLDGEKSRYSAKVSAFDKNWIDENAHTILNDIYTINQQIGKIQFYNAFLQNINPLSLLNTIQLEFKKIQEEQNVLSISDFNSIIHNQIKEQPAPFIYERLGEKYRHYFIDEFQDTSVLQWQNLVPLINNALSSEEYGIKGTLMLVGDPKQAIYRWRGGKAEQFIALSKNENPFSNKDKWVEDLKTNYRSYSEIIEFNNSFFNYLSSKFENEDYADLYKNHSYQKVTNKKGGCVSISFIENTEPNEIFEDETSGYSYKTQQYLQKTIETIQYVKANGFSYKDIVVLTRKKKHGIALANFLTENAIPVITSETLLIQNATEVKLIIAVLRFLTNNKDLESKSFMLYYVAKYNQNKQEIHDFIAQHIQATESKLEKVLQQLNIPISFTYCKTKALYEMVEIIVQSFLQEKANTAYVHYFQDLVLEKESKTQLGVADFLNYWDTKGFQKSIPTPNGIDAVQIMTIHKAKGLEFPVVIYPFAEESLAGNTNDKMWIDFDDTDVIDFPNALVNLKKDVVNYGERAEQQYFQKSQEDLLDTINVLYVALTRAEEQLYIISNKIQNKEGFNQNNLAYFFIEYLQLQNKFSNEETVFQIGNSKRISVPKKTINNNKNITVVPQKLERNKIKIAKQEALLWNTTQAEAINYGVVIHEILAWIYSYKDVAQATQKAIQKGLITENQSETVIKTLNEVVQNKLLQDFFNTTGLVYNERTMVDSIYGNSKPDKVVVNGNKALLLDYKTGEKKPSHEKQLLQYQEILTKMNLVVEKKVLVYIGETIEIITL
ncbi:UvrD-helicase domain-containing protein [Flavobacterium sp.]|uniref:UvrD-helicase domain-containing protein n=1 Tax=Flavobacterium sp. TaxID=239 RepID=UPI003528990C